MRKDKILIKMDADQQKCLHVRVKRVLMSKEAINLTPVASARISDEQSDEFTHVRFLILLDSYLAF